MTPEDVLAAPAKVLTQAQRESYFEKGYLLVEKAIDEDWLARLRAVTDGVIEESRAVRESDTLQRIQRATLSTKRAAVHKRQFHVGARANAGQQVISLEHEAYLTSAYLGQPVVG